MLKLSLPLAALLGAALTSHAAIIFSENFDAVLNPDWVTADIDDGAVASLDQANGRYEYTGQTSPTGERARLAKTVPTTLSLSSDWTISVDMSMGALSDFATAAEFSNGLLLNTLQLKATETNNDVHRIEFNLAMLDSDVIGAGLGVTSGFRFAEQFRPDGGGSSDVFSEIDLTATNTAQDIRAYLSYDSTAEQLIAGIDTGSGLVRFTDAVVDTSGWNIATGAFEVFLESSVGLVRDDLAGPANLAVTSGELYYDNLTVEDSALVPVPEPSTFALLSGFCVIAFAITRRR